MNFGKRTTCPDVLWTSGTVLKKKDVRNPLVIFNFSQVHFNCFTGSGHGSNIEKSFVLQKAIELKPGLNNISLLGATVGFPVITQLKSFYCLGAFFSFTSHT